MISSVRLCSPPSKFNWEVQSPLIALWTIWVKLKILTKAIKRRMTKQTVNSRKTVIRILQTFNSILPHQRESKWNSKGSWTHWGLFFQRDKPNWMLSKGFWKQFKVKLMPWTNKDNRKTKSMKTRDKKCKSLSKWLMRPRESSLEAIVSFKVTSRLNQSHKLTTTSKRSLSLLENKDLERLSATSLNSWPVWQVPTETKVQSSLRRFFIFAISYLIKSMNHGTLRERLKTKEFKFITTIRNSSRRISTPITLKLLTSM